jgi:hypothetical protein
MSRTLGHIYYADVREIFLNKNPGKSADLAGSGEQREKAFLTYGNVYGALIRHVLLPADGHCAEHGGISCYTFRQPCPPVFSCKVRLPS